MNRRRFLRRGGATMLAGLLPSPWLFELSGAESPVLPDPDFASWLTSPQPEVLRLVQDVFHQCVIGKLCAPKGTLKHPWITAGGGYVGQWLWDPMFVVDLLSLLPGQEQTIREVFQNYWDFQDRWNAQMPTYAHDMVACMITPDNENWLKAPAYSQIPILAWGVGRVYRRNRDRQLLAQCLPRLERFHEWSLAGARSSRHRPGHPRFLQRCRTARPL